MLKKLLYLTAFFWVILNFIIPTNKYALLNSNWVYLLGEAFGRLIIALIISLILIGFESLVNHYQKPKNMPKQEIQETIEPKAKPESQKLKSKTSSSRRKKTAK
jgi:hypothetical protein